MSYPKAVEEATLELITALQGKEYLKQFHLAGGTALALYLGHRKSIDIDLFSNVGFDTAVLLENLHQDFSFQLFFTAPNTLKGSINAINIDILAHRYKLLEPAQLIGKVTALSQPDIVAMKLNAICTTGQRSKDFVDIYYLLNTYNIGNMLDFYMKKYDQRNDGFLLKSLIYFDDVDLADWPVIVRDPLLKWPEIKKRIKKAVSDYLHGK